MRTLTPEEGLTLRLLHETGEVDVSFFERLYSCNPRGTYTQRYKTTFDQVKKNLVRRGLVVMAEVKMRSENTQLERWRFALPPEFSSCLPAITMLSSSEPGQVNEQILRKKLLQLVGGPPAIPKDELPLLIKNGSLFLKDDPFSTVSLGIWQKEAWWRTTATDKTNIRASLSPVDAVLKLLSTEGWTEPQNIEAAIKIYCFGAKSPSVAMLLQTGWSLGLLSRLEIHGTDYYRIVPPLNFYQSGQPYPVELTWADTVSNPGSVKIDLKLVPISDLEKLNALTDLSVNISDLMATPSLIKLGRARPQERSSAVSHWLAEQVPAFGEALKIVNARWGKTFLHENLLFARVQDLSLRVQLERELKDKVVVLSEHFIAFPSEARSQVEKVLKKTGFVTKSIKA
ncbi:MAG: hypothetical protein NT121_17155 [Chloroflexi bacterium]|nr:hypothetical protein [Chloroflexota bacterium]